MQKVELFVGFLGGKMELLGYKYVGEEGNHHEFFGPKGELHIYVDDDENYEEDEDGNQLSSCDVLNKKYEVIANIKFLDIVDLIEEIKKLNLK